MVSAVAGLCSALVVHGVSKMDSKPLLLSTKANANNAIEASKAAGRQKITSAGKLANFSERNCATCVVKGGK